MRQAHARQAPESLEGQMPTNPLDLRTVGPPGSRQLDPIVQHRQRQLKPQPTTFSPKLDSGAATRVRKLAWCAIQSWAEKGHHRLGTVKQEAKSVHDIATQDHLISELIADDVDTRHATLPDHQID